MNYLLIEVLVALKDEVSNRVVQVKEDEEVVDDIIDIEVEVLLVDHEIEVLGEAIVVEEEVIDVVVLQRIAPHALVEVEVEVHFDVLLIEVGIFLPLIKIIVIVEVEAVLLVEQLLRQSLPVSQQMGFISMAIEIVQSVVVRSIFVTVLNINLDVVFNATKQIIGSNNAPKFNVLIAKPLVT